MDVEQIREYCLSKPDVEECFPFDNETLVFKVQGSIFCLMSLDSDVFSFNVKCDPERAVELRELYTAVAPGYHMNKKHWNTITVDSSLSRVLLQQFIDESYDLVRKKPKTRP